MNIIKYTRLAPFFSLLVVIMLSMVTVLAAQDDETFFASKAAGLTEGRRLTLAQEALRLAQSYIDKGQNFGKALDKLYEAKAYDPELPFVEFELGRLFESWQVNLRDRALLHYQRFIEMRPKDSRGLIHLANLTGWFGQKEEAERLYKLGIANANPDSSWEYNEYARFLLNYTDRFADANKLILTVMERIRPQDLENDPWIWRNKGLSMLKLGEQKEKAVSDLQKAKSIFLKFNDTYQASQINFLLALYK